MPASVSVFAGCLGVSTPTHMPCVYTVSDVSAVRGSVAGKAAPCATKPCAYVWQPYPDCCVYHQRCMLMGVVFHVCISLHLAASSKLDVVVSLRSWRTCSWL